MDTAIVTVDSLSQNRIQNPPPTPESIETKREPDMATIDIHRSETIEAGADELWNHQVGKAEARFHWASSSTHSSA